MMEGQQVPSYLIITVKSNGEHLKNKTNFQKKKTLKGFIFEYNEDIPL